MKYLGRTVVVGKLLGAEDLTAKFEINGQVFEIPAIEDQGDFLSPLNRIDEFPEPRTMKEFLMHPRKSAKRKLKKNDFVLLTLQRYMNDENKIDYKLQNAITFIRSVNTEDELDYKGFIFNVDDVQRFFKKDENLPLYLIKFSSSKKSNSEIISIGKELLENEITNKFIFTFKDGEEFKRKNVVLEIKPELLKNEKDEEHFINFETFKTMISDLEKRGTESDGKVIFNISFFHSGTKKKEILDKYESIFLKNAKTKNPKNEIEKILNEDIEAYYSHRRKKLDSDSFSEKEIYGKIINDKGDFLMAPSIVSFKQSRSNEDEENSFYLVSSIVPDVIAMRKRAIDYLKKQITNNEENIPDNIEK